jgi:hypothetical protein
LRATEAWSRGVSRPSAVHVHGDDAVRALELAVTNARRLVFRAGVAGTPVLCGTWTLSLDVVYTNAIDFQICR